MARIGQSWDVTVLGGGLAGVAAAFATARAGQKTLLVERRPALGWEIAWAHAPGTIRGAGAFADVLLAALADLGLPGDERLDPAFFEIALDRVLEEAGVTVLLYAQPVHLSLAGNTAQAVTVATKGGMRVIRSRAFVDATENGLLWQQAGAKGSSTPESGRFSIALWCGPGAAGAKLGDLGAARDLTLSRFPRAEMLDLSFEMSGASVHEARLLVPEVLRRARAPHGPLAPEAVVTHTPTEVLPLAGGRLAGSVGEAHPRVANLLGSGLWLLPAPAPAELPAALLRAGERAGTLAPRVAAKVSSTADAVPLLPIEPTRRTCDVLIAGGGTAGALAALAAARRGRATTVLEAGTCLGGIACAGGIHMYYFGITGGLQDEVDARVAELAPLFAPADRVHGFHAEAKKIALEVLAHEAGVDITYGAILCGAVTETVASSAPARRDGPDRALRHLREALSAGPNGLHACAARVFVDATGDGDLAGAAGAECRFGREGDGLLHAYSLSSGRVQVGETPAEFKLRIVNYDAGYMDPTDAEDLTRARREALRLYPTDRNPEPLYIAPALGIRCGRLIVGDQTLTLADLILGRRFPDAVMETWGHYDNHAHDYEFESDAAVLWVWMLGHWRHEIGSEIPYGVMLPRGIEGLLVACRAISLTPDSHHLLRMQRDMQRLGEVAGIAADLALTQGCTPRQVNIEILRGELVRSGALMPPGEEPRFLARRREVPADRTLPPAASPADLEADLLVRDHPAASMLLLETARQDPGARAVLRRGLDSAAPMVRVSCAAALAMCEDRAAVPVLLEAVRTRQGTDMQSRCAQPVWFGAMVMLGRLRANEAVPDLLAIVQDPQTPYDAFAAAVRALGRIGDPQAAPVIERLIGREDLLAVQESAQPAGPLRASRWDRRWQLELLRADALGRLGRPRPDLVAPYLDDIRAPVRRWAEAIAAELGAPQTQAD